MKLGSRNVLQSRFRFDNLNKPSGLELNQNLNVANNPLINVLYVRHDG